MYFLRKSADYQTLKEELKKNGLQNEVAVVKTGCHGLCAEGPVMIVYPEAMFYSNGTSGRYCGDCFRASIKRSYRDTSRIRRGSGAGRNQILK